MKVLTRIVVQVRPRTAILPSATLSAFAVRHIHSTPVKPATVTSLHGTGPPPEPPVPEANRANERLERRKKQAALLRTAQDIRAQQNAPKSSTKPLRRRFWKDVHVKEVDGAWEVHLDTRPLRHPTTKQIVRLPLSKPLLAAALAHEWDMLTSAQQATRQHLIPLTSLVCRAIDIAEDDATSEQGPIRSSIVRMVMRYLDTDSLLCWAPPPQKYDVEEGTESLRDRQKRTAEEIVGFLRSKVWPGVEIEPVLDEGSIVPRKQKDATRQIIEGWVLGLSPWELAGLEKGVLAGKSLLGAVRLLVEWSEGFVGTGIGDGADGGDKKFGVEEAAKASNLEVEWQTERWGEVEDTHDVGKEDLRRQFGSVVLLVAGTGKK